MLSRWLIGVLLAARVAAQGPPDIRYDAATDRWWPAANSPRFDPQLQVDVFELLRLKHPGGVVLIDHSPVLSDGEWDNSLSYASDVTHGEVVSACCLDLGFTGALVCCPDSPALPEEVQKLSVSAARLRAQRQVTPEDVLAMLGDQAEYDTLAVIYSAATPLRHLARWRLRGVVVNLSKGVSQARHVRAFYPLLADNPRLLAGAARAWKLDLAALLSLDESASMPQRALLQQQLVDLVEARLSQSARLKAALEDYRRAVVTFEEGGNSVVVSAGNDGYSLQHMARLAGGKEPRVPADWMTNLLLLPETTNVGAADAEYSSPSPLLDVVAPGRAANCFSLGTSFAAPRVAAVLAELHRRNPQLTSQEVEDRLIREFTDSGARLDLDKIRSWMKGSGGWFSQTTAKF